MSETRPRYVIIVAGGSGTRMGASVPKQFLYLDTRTVLQHTVERFVEALPDIKVVTVLPREHIGLWKDTCLKDHLIIPQIIVTGGITRFHSVKNALAHIPDGAVVGVHDGVRPFVSAGLIRSLYEQVEQGCPALIPVLPCTDTLKALRTVRTEDGTARLETIGEADPDRSILYGAQTPQVFRSEVLKQAYTLPFSTAFTDDASVVAKNGTPLSWMTGERLNLKITCPEDLVLSKGILATERPNV